MKEIREIINAQQRSVAAGKKTALATVVHVDGSSYRRPGARMLIDDQGQITGAISGGCLEGDALRKALLVIDQNQSKLVTYDTSDEDDVSFGVQLGCAGIIQVLLEPIDALKKHNPIFLLQKAIARRQASVVITFFSVEEKNSSQVGTSLLIEEDETITGINPFPAINFFLMNDAKLVMESLVSSYKNYELDKQKISAFIQFLPPAVSLVVVGAGNDAIPLVSIADVIGWDVKVVDGRHTHAKSSRFASACQVLVSRPEDVLSQLFIDRLTVFVLMTHNYNYDIVMLKALLERNVTYIGVLGPKKKLDRMLEDLKNQGMILTDTQLNSVYGPVGLDIGAETAEEIALSIVAEIKAVLTGKGGISLRDKQDVIHSRLDTTTEKGPSL